MGEINIVYASNFVMQIWDETSNHPPALQISPPSRSVLNSESNTKINSTTSQTCHVISFTLSGDLPVERYNEQPPKQHHPVLAAI